MQSSILLIMRFYTNKLSDSSFKLPITSLGIVPFTIINNEIHYLMICRKDSVGYVDFVRGKYNLFNKHYICNIVNVMTIEEKDKIKNVEFTDLWSKLWGENKCFQYRNEQKTSSEKLQHLKEGVSTNYDSFNLLDCINASTTAWKENEWGFPKGRKNYQENDLTCAIREFEEETGISHNDIVVITNVFPFQEIFTGSNMKSYKHKYYLGYVSDHTLSLTGYQQSEVSKTEWKSLNQAIDCIRDYHYERKQILYDIDRLLRTRIMVDL